MKVFGLMMSCTVLCCLGLGVFLYAKRMEKLQLVETQTTLNIKSRINKDLEGQYQTESSSLSDELTKRRNEVEVLEKDVASSQSMSGSKKAEVDTCQGEKKKITDETAALEGEKKNTEENFSKEKNSLTEEINNLQMQMQQPSKACKFLDQTKEEGKKLCEQKVAVHQ